MFLFFFAAAVVCFFVLVDVLAESGTDSTRTMVFANTAASCKVWKCEGPCRHHFVVFLVKIIPIVFVSGFR